MSEIQFLPGQKVKVKKLGNSPTMIVKNRVYHKGKFQGMLCYWFTPKREYKSSTFNTKDLIHV